MVALRPAKIEVWRDLNISIPRIFTTEVSNSCSGALLEDVCCCGIKVLCSITYVCTTFGIIEILVHIIALVVEIFADIVVNIFGVGVVDGVVIVKLCKLAKL